MSLDLELYNFKIAAKLGATLVLCSACLLDPKFFVLAKCWQDSHWVYCPYSTCN